MKSNNGPKWEAVIGVGGVILPYAFTFLVTLLFAHKIGDHDYYSSGKLSTFDTITGWLTLVFLFLGALLCLPWIKSKIEERGISAVMILALASALVVQFVTVFIVRFLIYAEFGGIL